VDDEFELTLFSVAMPLARKFCSKVISPVNVTHIQNGCVDYLWQKQNRSTFVVLVENGVIAPPLRIIRLVVPGRTPVASRTRHWLEIVSEVLHPDPRILYHHSQ